jgi:hypothetical protein
MQKWEKYEKALQDRIEVLGKIKDRQMLHDYHRLVAARNKEELIEIAKNLKYSEAVFKEGPFVIKVSRNGNILEFREAQYVKYLLMLQEQIKQLHNMTKFRGFYLVFPDPTYPSDPEKLKSIPLAFLFNPAEQGSLFGENWVKITKIYRSINNEKQAETIKTLDAVSEIKKAMDFYLENAFYSRFGLIFYRPTYPYIHW